MGSSKTEKREYSFPEVIANIQENQEYRQVEHGIYQIRITKENGQIHIDYYNNDNRVKDTNWGLIFDDRMDRFILIEK